MWQGGNVLDVQDVSEAYSCGLRLEQVEYATYDGQGNQRRGDFSQGCLPFDDGYQNVACSAGQS
jgi:hypothetical protein